MIPRLQDVFGKRPWKLDAVQVAGLRADIFEFVRTFDYKLKPFSCSGYELCLVDVGSGSDTKVMARQVLDWSKRTSATGKVFDDPNFTALKVGYRDLMKALTEDAPTDRLREICSGIRNQIQAVSAESEVPIEPPTQTSLLDELLSDTSIAYACVPGAGGDDAFVCLRKPDGDL